MGVIFFSFIMLAVNFGISWWNARSVGKIWSESKAIGGGTRLLAISGYIMAVAGFTMVYVTILMVLIGTIGPQVAPEYIGGYEGQQILQLVGDLSYVLIITAIIPTGIIIWINSLITFWKHKSLRTGGVAVWNTFATISNTVNAVRNMPSALGRIKKAFSNNERGSGNIIFIAVVIVLVAVLGGYFTASAIVKRQDRKYDLVQNVTGQKLAQ